MNLLKNPFYILGATPRDNRQRIAELAEEHSLEQDPDMCREARAILTNPRRRLSAEIAWLPGVEPDYVVELLQILEANPAKLLDIDDDLYYKSPLACANLLALGLTRQQNLDADCCKKWIIKIALAFQHISHCCDELVENINNDRIVSNFPQISDISSIEAEINERGRFICTAIKDFLDKLNPEITVRVITDVVESSTDNGKEQALILIDELVDQYEVEVQDDLDNGAENIKDIIEKIYDAADNKQPHSIVSPLIDQLITVTKDWDRTAQPIQVSTKSRGLKHEASTDLAGAIRELAVYLYNEHGRHDYSLQIINLLQEVFAEVVDVAERVAEDADALKEKAWQDPFNELLNDVYNEIQKRPALGYVEAKKISSSAPEIITKMKIAGVSTSVIQKNKDLLAMALMHCAIAHGNSTKEWTKCATLLYEALNKYAISSDVKSKIQENLKIVEINVACQVRDNPTDGLSDRVALTIGIGVVVVLCILGAFICGGNSPSEPVGKSSTPSNQNRLVQTTVETSSQSYSGNNQSSANNFYTSPPTGKGNVLSMPEIRWCVRQEIRLDVLNDNLKTQKGVDKYNELVADYNSRCADYRYREGNRQRAEREVGAQRKQIEEEVIGIFKAFEDSVRRSGTK